jgi:hypothetical protein
MPLHSMFSRFGSLIRGHLPTEMQYLPKSFTKLQAHSHGTEPVLRGRQLCSYSGTSQHFMEPKGSLPCSQKPAIGPFPESDQSNPYHHIISL